ncbi:MAG TPA: PspC domain-containing protein [Streptosporangiaceae bacterium]|jgi:phage shock protein PspC (stress-responsive transcriptional regulator)
MTAGPGDTDTAGGTGGTGGGTGTGTAGTARAFRPVQRGGGDARLIGGVCAGLGRATGIDPIVFRVAVVVLTVGGGVGVLVYAAGWLLMPAEDQPASLIEGWSGRRYTASNVLSLLSAIVAAGFLLSLIGGPGGATLVTLVVLALGVLTAQKRGVDLGGVLRSLPDQVRGRPASPDEAAPAASMAGTDAPPRPGPPPVRPDGLIDLGAYGRGPHTAQPAGPDDPATGFGPYEPPVAPQRARRGGSGWPASLFFLAACGACVWAMAVTAPTYGWYATVTWGYGAAVAMIVIGVGLVVGAWFGRTRSLVFWGVVLAGVLVALPMIGTGSVKEIHTVWRPTTVAQASRPVHLGFGAGKYDLTRVPFKPGTAASVTADMNTGYVVVVVPRGARVHVTGAVAVGGVHAGDDTDQRSGRRIDVTLGPKAKSAPEIDVHLRGTTGYMEVRRAA